MNAREMEEKPAHVPFDYSIKRGKEREEKREKGKKKTQ